jgi:chromosome segregation ATPase
MNRLTMNDVQIAQILGRIADCADAVKDPEFRKRLREDVLTLPDEVKAAAEKAQNLIANGESLKANIKKLEDDSNSRIAQREQAIASRENEMKQLSSRKAEVEALEARNKVKEDELKKAQNKLDTSIAAQAEITAKNKIKEDSFFDERKKLDLYKDSLDKREKEIAAYEQQINETAQQMSGLVKSKLRK